MPPSDEEMEYMDEQYDFEYSDDSYNEHDFDLENQYYNSKAMKSSDPKAAFESFEKVLEMEREKGEWGFKSLKQMVKISYSMGMWEQMMDCYMKLLTYIRGAVSRNYSEKSITNLLEFMSSSSKKDLLEKVYEATLNALKELRNERLWFKTNIRLAKLFLDRKDFERTSEVIKELRMSCKTEDNNLDENKKGTQLLEIYALEIQMYTEQKNNAQLKELYEQSLRIKSGIPHPLTMGIIRECGGKMHLREGEFQLAHQDFFEAFKSYDESGNARRIRCLKYVVLANMLVQSNINPFDSQETKAYQNDPEILAMTKLVRAYQDQDVVEFQKIIEEDHAYIMTDEFICERLQDLLRNVRTKVLIQTIKPYTQIRLKQVADTLRMEEADVVELLAKCILDKEFQGKLDCKNGLLVIEKENTADSAYCRAIDSLLDSLSKFSEKSMEQLI
ncbi:COP9 signalosome complex subunit [Trichinella pseudospiralis]|uniref:COP9 signalosome complex subunit n=1 Tax=Trichinella pseudospiralis TaxID=6337 RepID=A0A0V1FI01_TRIPS|nr:COP9 signalosome complex subunit [Trichinella pseudospiralis]